MYVRGSGRWLACRKRSIDTSCLDGPRDGQTEWSKSEREKQVSQINRYMWSLEKWCRWTYLQSRNRDTEVENVWSPNGTRGAWDGLGDWGWHICTPDTCILSIGLPWELSWQRSACNNARRPRFHSWVRRIPWRKDRLPTPVFLGFPGGSEGKESTCNAGDLGSIPALGRSNGVGHDNPVQYACLENLHGQRSLVGYSSWAHKELDMTERLSTTYPMYKPKENLLYSAQNSTQCRK